MRRQASSLDGWLSSPNAEPVSFPEFYAEAYKLPIILKSSVRHVSCYRRGAHGYILVHALVSFSVTQQPIATYFRLEHGPTGGNPQTLRRWLNPTGINIRMNRNLDTLHRKGSLATWSYNIFGRVEHDVRTLMLEHILEIYACLVERSSMKDTMSTKYHWFCFGFLECLRECKFCFNGLCFEPTKKYLISEKGVQTAIQARDCYLSEFHPRCCWPRLQTNLAAASPLAEANTLSSNITTMPPGQAQHPEVTHSTVELVAPFLQPIPLPSLCILLSPDNVPRRGLPEETTRPMDESNISQGLAPEHLGIAQVQQHNPSPDLQATPPRDLPCTDPTCVPRQGSNSNARSSPAYTTQLSLPNTISDHSRLSSLRQNSIWLNSISLISMSPP